MYATECKSHNLYTVVKEKYANLNINLNNYDLWAANWCFVGLKKNI